MAKSPLYSLVGSEPSWEQRTTGELLGLLRRAEQSRRQLGAFVDQITEELCRRRTGPPHSAA